MLRFVGFASGIGLDGPELTAACTPRRMEGTVILLALLACLVSSEPVLLNKETFSEAVDSGKPCFVKFFAPW